MRCWNKLSKTFTAVGIVAMAGLFAPAVTSGEKLQFSSGDRQVSLVELYTSEGCSSCPPADKWMSSKTGDGDLWRSVVPVAFHVDYWDYIGWKDPFASPRYTSRQHAHAQRLGMRTVYTPGVFANGAEWRHWRERVKPPVAADAPGNLTVNVSDGTVMARFDPATQLASESLELNVALLGFDLKTDVKSGENRGRELEHDFVVLGMTKAALKDAGANGMNATITLPKSAIDAPRLGLAAWVARTSDTEPLQATGGWLTPEDK